MGILIRGGRLVDPASGTDAVQDVLLEGGIVKEIGTVPAPAGAEVVDAGGCVVAPGLVDLHAHLREPGREDEETVASGAAAAAAGGYTALLAMPNTDPVADSVAVVERVWAAGEEADLVEVLPAGAISIGLRGEELADLGAMAASKARVRLFTDDGHGVQSAALARRAMRCLRSFDGIYAEHCEDAALAAGGQMHEGVVAASLGLKGIPSAAEELMAARDIVLARATGCRLHLLHVSTAGTVRLVRAAKEEGLPVSAEATPHHFTLTHEEVAAYDPHAKVNPPLRTEEDRAAVVEGLASGVIDAIATDHAPHAAHEKEQGFDLAPPGLVGLETALALALTHLVLPGHVSLMRMIEMLSTAPARILGLEGQGRVVKGRPANVVVFDPAARWTVDPLRFRSLARNTPFGGRVLTGRVRHTFFRGRQTVKEGEVLCKVPA